MTSTWRSTYSFNPFKILAERAAQVVALEGEFHRGFQESEFVAGVVAAAFVDVGVHFFLLQQHAHAVGELQFAAGAGLESWPGNRKSPGVRM